MDRISRTSRRAYLDSCDRAFRLFDCGELELRRIRCLRIQIGSFKGQVIDFLMLEPIRH